MRMQTLMHMVFQDSQAVFGENNRLHLSFSNNLAESSHILPFLSDSRFPFQ